MDTLKNPDGDCPDGKWKQPITTRHCLYHVYPFKGNDDWIDNVNVLGLWSTQAFNGRKIAAIATDSTTHDYDATAGRLEALGFECFERPNDPTTREVITFRPLLRMVETVDPTVAVFYAHTKGNTTCDGRVGARIWRNVGYRELVREWSRCADLLAEYAAVGIHQITWKDGDRIPYPNEYKHGHWMFAGTFFWFRADRIFSLPSWSEIDLNRYAAEAWLSVLVDPRDAKSVYNLWPEYQYPTPSPYAPYIYPQADQDWEPLA